MTRIQYSGQMVSVFWQNNFISQKFNKSCDTGLTSYKEALLSQRGRATHVDPTYVSPGDAWFEDSAVLHWARIDRIGAFGRGGRSLCAKISHGKGQPLYQPFLAWSVSGLSSAVEPPDAPMDATLPFSLMSMTSVVSYSALCHIREATFWSDVVSNSAKY